MRNTIPVIVSLAASVAAAPQFQSSFGAPQQQNGPPQQQQQNGPPMGMNGPSQNAPPMNGNSQNAPSPQGARKPDRARQGGATVFHGIAYPLPTQAGSQQQSGPPQGMSSQQQQQNGPPQQQQQNGPPQQQQNGPPQAWSSQGGAQQQSGPPSQQQQQGGPPKNHLPPWAQQQQPQPQAVTVTQTVTLSTMGMATPSAQSGFSYGAPPQGMAFGGPPQGMQQNGPPSQGMQDSSPWSGPSHGSQQQQQSGPPQDMQGSSSWNGPSQGGSQQQPSHSQGPPQMQGSSSWSAPSQGSSQHGAPPPWAHHPHHHGHQQPSPIVITVTQTPSAAASSSQSGIPIEAFVGGLPTLGPLIENGHIIEGRKLASRDLAAQEAQDLIIPNNLKDIALKLEADLKEKIEDMLSKAKVNDIIAKVVELISDIKSGDFKEKLMDKIPEFLAMIKQLFSADNIAEIKKSVDDVIGGTHGLADVRQWADKMKEKVEGRNGELVETLQTVVEGLKDQVGGLLGGAGGLEKRDFEDVWDDLCDFIGDGFRANGGGISTPIIETSTSFNDDPPKDVEKSENEVEKREVDPIVEKVSGHFDDVVDALKDKFHNNPAAIKKENERIKAKGEKLLKSFEGVQAALKAKLEMAQATGDDHNVKLTSKVTAGLAHITEIIQSFKEKAHELAEKTGAEKGLKDLLPKLKAKAEAAIKDIVTKVLASVKTQLPHVDGKLGTDVKSFLRSHEVDAMRVIADIVDKMNGKGKGAAGIGSDLTPGAFP